MLAWGEHMEYLKKNYLTIVFVCAAFIGLALALSEGASSVPTASTAVAVQTQIVIDAGHGGEDGGAVSCTGVNESSINLEISLRLNDFCHLLGCRTVMLRTEDSALYDPGAGTISEKKVSDLKNRVKLVNETDNALLISIHQNQFSEEKYHGAQVFYAPTGGSEELAEQVQQALRTAVDPQNNRQCKRADSVYLMNEIQCTGILVECGFLSNRMEEAQLRDPAYQKQLAAVIGCCVSNYLQKEPESNAA